MTRSPRRAPISAVPVRYVPWWLAVWLPLTAGFVAIFLLSPLLESRGGRPAMTRWLALFLLSDPIEHIANWFGEASDQSGLLDRLPLLLKAGLIELAAYGWGAGLLRAVQVERALSRWEAAVYSLACGLNVVSLATLLLGWAGILRGAGAWVLVLAGAAAGVWHIRASWKTAHARNSPARTTWWLALLTVPFVVPLALGAPLPPWEFDVLEYHLQAPKEWHQLGRIAFLPHNVYASMPLGAEMQALLAMSLGFGDDAWWRGALAGKFVMASFAPLTGLALVAAGRRFFGPAEGDRIGWTAALFFLATPWVPFVSMAGLNEGASACYLLLTLMALVRWWTTPASELVAARGLLLLSGFCAGAAVACKYPAVLFVVAPSLVVVAVRAYRAARPDPRTLHVVVRAIGLFGLAASVACGPWFAKNAVQTGNPTYPLLSGLFGGATRGPEKDRQWRRAHSPPADGFTLAAAGASLRHILVDSRWNNPMLLPLAALAFADSRRRRFVPIAGWIAGTVVVWWLATHRVDRFLVPLLPLWSGLAAIGAAWGLGRTGRGFVVGLMAFGLIYGWLVATSPLMGETRFFARLDDMTPRPGSLSPQTQNLPPGSHVLFVGEARAFEHRVPVSYETCFDDCRFERLLRDVPPSEAGAVLRGAGFTHVLIHWLEIDRYRSTGNYGFTDFVRREFVVELLRAGALRRWDERSDEALEMFFVEPVSR